MPGPARNRYTQAAELRVALRHFLRRSEQCARRHGLTPGQHQILLQIAASPDGVASISDLVSRLASTQSAVTELVQRAEAAGLIKRRSSAEDGRVVELSLTALGRRRLDRVHEALGPERALLQDMINKLP